MVSKKKNFLADNISVEEILKIFLKEKLTIIVISLAFSIFFGLLNYYGINQIKKNQKIASVKVSLVGEDLKYLSLYYNNFLPNNILFERKTDFKNFKFEISSSNFAEFFEQRKDRFDDFYNYFEKSNILAQDYFFKNFKKIGKDIHFTYPRQLQGETLIKEFIISEINRYKKELKNNIKKNLLIHLKFIEKIKQISVENDFENNQKVKQYITSWNIFSNSKENIIDFDYTISITKSVLEKLDDDYFNYPFSFDFKTEVKKIKNKYSINSLKNFIFVGLVFGFFLSLIIVFFKNLISKDKL